MGQGMAPRGGAQYDLAGLARLLSETVGDEKAEEAVREGAKQAGVSATAPLTLEQALEVLEKVAATPGIVGVTARFAKSRLHLARR